MARVSQRKHSHVEQLEGRQLLSGTHSDYLGLDGQPINYKDLVRLADQTQNGVPLDQRRLAFPANGGGQIVVTLYGAGTLEGTHLDDSGALHLVYDLTNSETRIEAKAIHTRGEQVLGSIRDRDVALDDVTGVGGNLLGLVNLRKFTLASNGVINLSAGVKDLYIAGAGPNSMISLRALPSNASGGVSIPAGETEGVLYTSQPNGGVEVSAVGLAPPAATSTSSSSTSSNTNSNNSNNNDEDKVPGVTLNVGRVSGSGAGPLGSAQFFGYDPAANALIRFDTGTGQALQTIPLAGASPLVGEVALTRINGAQTVVVSDGGTVYAFNASTGSAAGSFSLSSLSGLGIDRADGFGASSNGWAIIVDANAGSNGAGLIQRVDLRASLASGQAVAVGEPDALTREFQLAGGATGVAGLTNLYVAGSGFFDTATPNQTQLGIATLAGGPNSSLVEQSRAAVRTRGNYEPAPAIGQAGLGSVEGNLALLSGTETDDETGQTFNIVRLLQPRTLASQGTIDLAYANPLTGLSESFHPELQGSTLIDVRGNLRDFRAGSMSGAVVNVSGTLDRMIADSVSNSTVLGRPINHVGITRRGPGVRLISTQREVGTRGGVTIPKENPPVGPLTLPRLRA